MTSPSGYTRSFKGIAPEVHFISLAALDRYGAGKESNVIAAIERAIALKNIYNIRVMNLSLGKPVSKRYADDLLCKAAEKAWNAGIVVVVAAGNNGRNNSKDTQGYGTIMSPGNHPAVMTVGTVNMPAPRRTPITSWPPIAQRGRRCWTALSNRTSSRRATRSSRRCRCTDASGTTTAKTSCHSLTTRKTALRSREMNTSG